MMAGEEAAFDLFCDEYLPVLYRFAARQMKDPEVARELAQTALCKVIAKLDSFRADAPLLNWLYTCCRNEIGMYLRRKQRSEVQLDTDEERGALETWRRGHDLLGPEAALMLREKGALVHQVLDELPPRHARALEWKYLEQLPVAEIAERLEVTPKAAESLLTRARGAFRTRFQPFHDDFMD